MAMINLVYFFFGIAIIERKVTFMIDWIFCEIKKRTINKTNNHQRPTAKNPDNFCCRNQKLTLRIICCEISNNLLIILLAKESEIQLMEASNKLVGSVFVVLWQ